MNNSLTTNTIHAKYCSGWCVPTVIYAILAIISILINLFQAPPENIDRDQYIKYKLRNLLVQVVVASLWTLLMYWLCSNCHEGWAWFLLLVPFLFGLLLMFLVVGVIDFVLYSYQKQQK